MKLPFANGKYRMPAKIVSGTMACSALAVWFFYFYVYYQFDGSRPRGADQAAGRVFAQNNHGHVVYLTAAEHNRLIVIAILAGALFGTALLINALFVQGSFRRPSPKPWEVRRW
jgi:hypothetical protein